MQPTPPPATACGRHAPGRWGAAAGQGAPAAAGTGDIGTRRGPGVGAAPRSRAAEAARLSLQPAPGPCGRAPRAPRQPGPPARWVRARAGGGGGGERRAGRDCGRRGGARREHPGTPRRRARRCPPGGEGGPAAPGRAHRGGVGRPSGAGRGGGSGPGGSGQGCYPRSQLRAGARAALRGCLAVGCRPPP